MYLRNSELYFWNPLFFTESSKFDEKSNNHSFYVNIEAIKMRYPDVVLKEALVYYRNQWFYLPVYWSNNKEVQLILINNLSQNYTSSPLVIIPDILDINILSENPLQTDIKEIVDIYLNTFK